MYKALTYSAYEETIFIKFSTIIATTSVKYTCKTQIHGIQFHIGIVVTNTEK